MRVDRVEVLKRIQVINIDDGMRLSLQPGSVHFLEHAEGSHPLDYYVLQGTRHGAICRWWEDQEKEGVFRLVRVADPNDPTLDGIPLPITGSAQLTPHQKERLVCGYLVKGKFLCTKCALKHTLVHPNAVAVYPVNILPYSQHCEQCGLIVFNVWQSAKGGPLSLFDHRLRT